MSTFKLIAILTVLMTSTTLSGVQGQEGRNDIGCVLAADCHARTGDIYKEMAGNNKANEHYNEARRFLKVQKRYENCNIGTIEKNCYRKNDACLSSYSLACAEDMMRRSVSNRLQGSLSTNLDGIIAGNSDNTCFDYSLYFCRMDKRGYWDDDIYEAIKIEYNISCGPPCKDLVKFHEFHLMTGKKFPEDFPLDWDKQLENVLSDTYTQGWEENGRCIFVGACYAKRGDIRKAENDTGTASSFYQMARYYIKRQERHDESMTLGIQIVNECKQELEDCNIDYKKEVIRDMKKSGQSEYGLVQAVLDSAVYCYDYTLYFCRMDEPGYWPSDIYKSIKLKYTLECGLVSTCEMELFHEYHLRVGKKYPDDFPSNWGENLEEVKRIRNQSEEGEDTRLVPGNGAEDKDIFWTI